MINCNMQFIVNIHQQVRLDVRRAKLSYKLSYVRFQILDMHRIVRESHLLHT